jgi:outer membrane protein assembly factor BamB
MHKRLWLFFFICPLVSAFFHASAMAMTCDELRAEMATLEKQIAQDNDVLKNCPKYYSDCGPNSYAVITYTAAIEYSEDAYKADQASLYTTCGPPTRPPRKTVLFDVWTYHYDSWRTGWNSNETILTPAILRSSALGPPGTRGLEFGLLHTVPLDERVTAQPLLITNQWMSNALGTRDVVYVVTAKNSVYAIDAITGAVLLSRKYGDPFQPRCDGNSKYGDPPDSSEIPLGIMSTPVIDTDAGIMYLVTETVEDPPPGEGADVDFRVPSGQKVVHRIHSIDLHTLGDKSQVVSANHPLADGTLYSFWSLRNRQRAGLVYANRSVYAAFTAACKYKDKDEDKDVRGLLLGWDAATLQPLSANLLTNSSIDPSPTVGKWSGIWMSGFAVAEDSGNLYLVTSNSDMKYKAPNNLSHSVMKVSPDLTRVLDYFTPSNVNDLDDQDFGAGGILLLPPQPGSHPNLAVAAGKDGKMFLLDRDNLGKYSPVRNNVLREYPGGPCYCGPSYFKGLDGAARIVSSSGHQLKIWKLQTDRFPDPYPALVEEHVGTGPGLEQMGGNLDPGRGFFTSVSSNGLVPDTAVVWAVSNPDVTLYAFDAATGAEIGAWRAGTYNGAYFIVPVVANGRVYVAGDHQLMIFGLSRIPLPASPSSSPLSAYVKEDAKRVVGTVTIVEGSRIVLRTSEGNEVHVDTRKTLENGHSIPFTIGSPIRVNGPKDENGVVQADSVTYGE